MRVDMNCNKHFLNFMLSYPREGYMALIDSDKILQLIPAMLNKELSSDGKTIFRALEKVLIFDECFIYFANPESLQLKYSYKKHNNYEQDTCFEIDNDLKKLVFANDSNILDDNSELIQAVKLKGSRQKSYLLSKISIKSTVFGIILLSKREENYYRQEDLNDLDVIASILSYQLKDLELSNVFRIQLRALKDGILEKNNAYKTIKEQNEKILEADKVKNEFLANISHELRTPLNSILGFSDILTTQLYGNLNSKQEEYINDIKVSATHLLGMINEVLDMSKIEANAMKIVKSAFWISRAVNEVCNILKPLALKKNINLNLNMEVDFEVFADYQKIQQILYNLVSNAIKYSPENDNVEIKIEAFDEFYRISIHDNGIGIDKKYHGKIFAKFVQLDSAYTKKESSTGLGLTITKELVEMHEGKISLVSEVNNGSTFIVEIPF